MNKNIVGRKVTVDGAPIPEMIAGAIMGALASLVLTYIPELRGVLDPSSPTLYLILAVAALLGAVASFFLARKHVVEVKEQSRTEDASTRRAA